MRPEWRFAGVAAAALAVGSICAEPYARVAAPYYAGIDRLIAAAHPWTIDQVAVTPDVSGHGSVLRLTGEVRRLPDEAKPAAIVVSRLQVGEVIEAPIVFWTLLLMWPAASARQRWARLALGGAVFLALEAVTTAAQLAHPLAETSALLARGSTSASLDDPLTLWERWSRFLEAGGDFALAAAAALAALAVTDAIDRPRRGD